MTDIDKQILNIKTTLNEFYGVTEYKVIEEGLRELVRVVESAKPVDVDLGGVSQQRELLEAFMRKYNEGNKDTGVDWIDIEDINGFIESL